MGEQKIKWPSIKAMLFAYLAITKIIYWYHTVIAVLQDDLGDVGRYVISRLLGQDLLIIVGIVIMFLLDSLIHNRSHAKSQNYSKVVKTIAHYTIGYIAFMGFILIYFQIMSLTGQMSWGNILIYSSLTFLVVNVVFEIKEYIKAKFMSDDTPPAQNTEDKLAMLKTLFDDGVLTQEEYDCKKEIINSM
ncbi:MAG: SHOCT domain-containing protein [Defluviitaleaceae bacterium]|nr:SHOCT domain-containing protein [Defluviitaleaceae bacterium]